MFCDRQTHFIFALGGLDDEEVHSLPVELIQQMVNRVGLARTSRAGDERVRGERGFIQRNDIRFCFVHMIDMTQFNFSAALFHHIQRPNFTAKRNTFQNRQAAHRLFRKIQCVRQLAARKL